jgi:hypothetical protein
MSARSAASASAFSASSAALADWSALSDLRSAESGSGREALRARDSTLGIRRVRKAARR